MRFEIRHAEDFGTALREFRTLQGVSQAEVARSVGLNRTYLSNMEQGIVPTYLDRLMALVSALGLTITITES
jgi:transcriptional regulator with XRE-family HTH domain